MNNQIFGGEPQGESQKKCSRWSCLDRESHLRDWFCASYKEKPADIGGCKGYYKGDPKFVETGYERP